MACKGFDGQVVRLDLRFQSLLKNFVCVRLVQMRDVDLAQFQFDYDLTWVAMFLHPDGTVFARYGSRTEDGPMAVNSMQGLTNTMKRVLEAYRRYPDNKSLFAEKRGPKPKYRRPQQIPSRFTRRPEPASKENCVHCHNVYDAYHDLEIKGGGYDPRKHWKYPLPESVGLAINPAEGNRVVNVLPGSAAAEAGLRSNDVLEKLNGQAILSLADIQFVLHFLPNDNAELRAVVRRDGEASEKTLALSHPWREGNLSWRVSMYGMPPRPGLWIDKLPEEDERRLGLSNKEVALRVRGVFGDAVKRAGLRKGDVIVSYDGKKGRASPGEFHSYLRLHHYKPGSVLKLEVLRKNGKRHLDVKF